MKPGRNDSCPCGSGKKFKKCCEQHSVGAPSAQHFMQQQAEAAAAHLMPRHLPNPRVQAETALAADMGRLAAVFNAGRHTEAESLARGLIERHRDSGFAWKVLGAALKMQGKDALPALQRATALLPDDANAHYNLGVALQDLEHLDNATASYRRALEIEPDYAESHSNLGVILQDLGRLDDALACCRRALEINPNYAAAHSNLLLIHHYQPHPPAATLLTEAVRYGDAAARQARPYTDWRNIPEPGRRLRVGLVSGDLRDHPVGYFVEGMAAALASHAAGRLELVAYPIHDYADALSARIQACCCGWHSAAGLSDAQFAQRIRDDGIDILIDLSGHTAPNRLPMFAWKPAPVQASWLGYFATTGITAIDYLIADPWTLPEAEESSFTEQIWRLPETRLCFTPPDADVNVSPLPALANGTFTFGCFNNLTKMNHAVVALWASVLHAVPQSRLFLKAKQLASASVQQSVLERFAAHGIGAERLMLEGSCPRIAYFFAYGQVDIALDPFPYPGGATTAEALWMGVPVLTLAGEHFLARQGVGLLTNAGLPDWIATDADDYVTRAVAHAGDLPRLAALRAGLRQQVLASPIFDAPRFARHFEAALRGMWMQWCDQKTATAVPRHATNPHAPAETPTAADMELVALFNAGRHAETESRARELIEQYPDSGFAWKMLGAALKMQGKNALPAMQKATELIPDDAEAHNNLGTALRNLGRADDALTHYRRALQIAPDYAEAHSNLGNALKDTGRFDDAAASYRRALEIKPLFAEAHCNLGNTLLNLGQLDDTVTSYRRALEIRPDFTKALSNLLFIHNYQSDQPAAMLLAEARRFGDLAARQARPYTDWGNVPEPEKCLRVGLVSGDLGEHPVGYFLDSNLAALMSHACGRLELIAYHNHFHTDALTERIKACCLDWHSTMGLSDAQLAQLIRNDGIDILIDLVGHTAHNRLTMFAWKPAPVQASWLGYFATTGVAAMDYLIADPWTLPETEEANFTETIWRLPETRLCFTPPDADVDVSPLPALTNGRITFGCFNSLNKMNDAVVALWARVLHAAPESRLFLKAPQLSEASVQQNVLERFASHGIGADRLLLEGPTPRRDYLATYGRVDIALDPFPYTGGATTAEALWMGVPVLTLTGERFLPRQGVGLLANAGLPEWIAADADDYVARAISHAGDLPRLAAHRAGLRQQVLASPIFDAPRFARHFEAALRGMWMQWCDQKTAVAVPHHFLKHVKNPHLPSRPAPADPLTGVEKNRLVAMFNAGRHAETESSARLLIAQYPDSGFAWKVLGAVLKAQGKDALPALQKAIELLPDDANAHYNLGAALRDQGLLEDAAASYRLALAFKPDYANAHYNLGATLRNMGLPDEAAASFRRTLAINPDDTEAHNNLGGVLRDLGQFDDAAASYRRALQIKPDYAEAHSNLGITLKDLGRLDDALASYRRAVEIKPDYAHAHYNLGNALQELERLDEAETHYRQTLQIKPDFAEAHCNLGNALQGLGQRDGAAASYRRTLQLKPDYAEAHCNLATVLLDFERADEAAESCRRALQLKPDFVEAHNNLGNALKNLGKLNDAVASYNRALEIEPDYATAHINLGNLLLNIGRLDEAVASHRRALEFKPDYPVAHSNLLFALNYLADLPAAMLLAEARRYGDLAAQKASPTQTWLNAPEPERCLRVGLVSGDFCSHPVGFFVESVLAALASHACGRLEFIGYHSHFRTDALTERIKACCRGWHSTMELSDAQLAQLIRVDGIDILIDLSGHTAHNRLTMFASKPAPVQASWMGYFATTGVAAIDYLIADPWTLPETEEVNFTEKIWRLPETRLCFTPPDAEVAVSPLPALTNGRLTFGCFNSLNKMNDAVVALWANVLHAVPQSCLFLKAPQLSEASVRQNVLERFAAHGIGADRLMLEGSSPRRDYLATYGRVDIALDPFPYTGGATTAEALWMGVPVLTLAGERFLPRQGVGLLANAGLPEWIATDADDYVARAVSHAGNLPRLAALRAGLRQQALASPLFDAPRFARHFEAALRGMWMQWCDQKTAVAVPHHLPKHLPNPRAQADTPTQADMDQLMALYQSGRHAEAESSARALILRYPDSGFAWKVLGAALTMQGNPALPALQKATELLPDDAIAHFNLSMALQDLARFDEAGASTRRALQINPDFAEAHRNLGIICHELGKPEESEAHFRRVQEIRPDDAHAHYNLGNALKNLGRLDEAAASYRLALKIDPHYAEAHNMLGGILKDLGRLDDAVASYCRALEIKPDFAWAHNSLGNTLLDLGRFDDAAASYRRAIAILPDYAEAHNNLGNTLQDLRRFDDAMASYNRALEIKPDYAAAHINLGNLLLNIGRLDEAVASYRRALEIKPDSAEAHINLGRVLKDLGRLEDAVASYRRALEINPDFAEAHSSLLFAHNYLADQPAATLLAEARHFGDSAARKATPYKTWRNVPEPGKCLRVGLVSGDLGEHPVGYFLDSILAALMPTAAGRLELIAYHNHFRTVALTDRIKASCHAWHSAVGLSDAQLAQRIRDDGIDILIDLSGHTANNRLPMFAWKPAPVQASWLGYFATTGVAAIDYLIADPWTLPETEEVNFTETIWRLPETRLCFTPPDAEGAVSSLPASANGRLTFGCFNNLSKMNDAVVALWTSVLHAAPESRLFLKAPQLSEASVRQSVLKRFAAHGIDADRMMLEGPSPRRNYLAAYGRVDIALDPFPYTGGATTAEALWMGVPVLTLAGEHFLARQGVGLLANAGLQEWIATDTDDYVARAAAHAADLPRLAALRAGLRQQALASPIFDAQRFARHFDTVLRDMWTTWCNQTKQRQ